MNPHSHRGKPSSAMCYPDEWPDTGALPKAKPCPTGLPAVGSLTEKITEKPETRKKAPFSLDAFESARFAGLVRRVKISLPKCLVVSEPLAEIRDELFHRNEFVAWDRFCRQTLEAPSDFIDNLIRLVAELHTDRSEIRV